MALPRLGRIVARRLLNIDIHLGRRREYLPLEGPQPESGQAEGLKSNVCVTLRFRYGGHGRDKY